MNKWLLVLLLFATLIVSMQARGDEPQRWHVKIPGDGYLYTDASVYYLLWRFDDGPGEWVWILDAKLQRSTTEFNALQAEFYIDVDMDGADAVCFAVAPVNTLPDEPFFCGVNQCHND